VERLGSQAVACLAQEHPVCCCMKAKEFWHHGCVDGSNLWLQVPRHHQLSNLPAGRMHATQEINRHRQVDPVQTMAWISLDIFHVAK
jgi:hypothetical protein